MTPRQLLEKWIDAFNTANVDAISDLYASNAINHQVANEPVIGQTAIKQMFATEFANAQMVCIPENIFEDRRLGHFRMERPKRAARLWLLQH